MSRPSVSVVMPFAGSVNAAQAAIKALLTLELRPGDELILADNAGTVTCTHGVRVVRAGRERSPAHARNAGASVAGGEWILLLDADCRPRRSLLDDFFAKPVAARVGALAGEIVPLPGSSSVAARYAASRNFLGQAAHLAHPFLPRAAAANLLVRAAAFREVGGFHEGLRAAEDTDFCWRLQRTGWRLELRPEAQVEHRYRGTVGELRRQWRGYAAGRAWLARRYPGFRPQPAAARALSRASSRAARSFRGHSVPGGGTESDQTHDRASHQGSAGLLIIDALLAMEELVGFTQSNRPQRPLLPPADLVLVADHFPAGDAPFMSPAARIEAVHRANVPMAAMDPGPPLTYLEDDGALERWVALAGLAVRHPRRCIEDIRRHGVPGTLAVAAAVRRLAHDRDPRMHSLDAPELAVRLASLSGRRLAGSQP